jgi:hypothetical protein
MHNISPRRCLNPFRFLVFDSETADKPVSHANPHVTLRTTVMQLLYEPATPELREVGTSAKQLVEIFPSPYLTTIIQMRVSKIT